MWRSSSLHRRAGDHRRPCRARAPGPTTSPTSWAPSDGNASRLQPASEVLAVADLLDHLSDATVGVDLLEDVLGGHEPRVLPLAGRVHLLLEGAPRDLRDLGAAHPAHGRQDGAVVDVGEEG